MTHARLTARVVAAVVAALPIATLAQTLPRDGFPVDAPVCVERLRAQQAAGGRDDAVPRAGEHCPAFVEALGTSVWGVVDRTALDALTADGIEALGELAAHYAAGRQATVELSSGRLLDIAAELGPFDVEPQMSVWERFLHWVEERFNIGERLANSWLADWLRRLSLPPAWAATITYTVMALGVLCVVAIVINELWWSGALRRRVGKRFRARRSGGGPETLPFPTLESLRTLPAAQRPAVLLGVIVARLQSRFGGRFRDSMTPRELVAATAEVGLRRRDEFGAVATAVERIAYAGWQPGDDEADRVLADGRAVLEEIEAGESSR